MKNLDARKILHKEQKLTLSIRSFNAEGQGVARFEGITIFVMAALPGELVKAELTLVKKTYAVAKCLEVVKASVERTKPICTHYGLCGSCALQHMTYAASLNFKQAKVKAALSSITKLAETQIDSLVKPTLASPKQTNYRNKLVYNFARAETATTAESEVALNKPSYLTNTHDSNTMYNVARSEFVQSNLPFKLGFFAPKSHKVIDLDACPAEFEDAALIRQALRHVFSQAEFIEQAKLLKLEPLFYDEATNTGLFKRLMLRYSNLEQATLLTFILNLEAKHYTDKIAEFFREIAANVAKEVKIAGCLVNFQPEATNKIYSNDFKLVAGKASVRENLHVAGWDFSYEIGAADFFQVNPSCAEVLFTTALDNLHLTGSECVYDLYCGTGSISLPLASWAKSVIGIEIVPSAILHAKQNQVLNKLDNVDFYAGDAGELFPKLFKAGKLADVVVVDPPRKGLDHATIDTILAMQAEKVLYVSCDPGSLARDLVDLLKTGMYKLKLVQPVDMFPGSEHVETVVLMSKAHN